MIGATYWAETMRHMYVQLSLVEVKLMMWSMGGQLRQKQSDKWRQIGQTEAKVMHESEGAM